MRSEERQRRPSTGGYSKGSLLARIVSAFFKLQHFVGRRAGRTLASIRRGEHAFVVIVAIAIGVLGGYGAILFRELFLLSHGAFFFTFDRSIEQLREIPWWHRMLMPSVGGLLVGLIVTRFSPEVRGSGIPEVMEAVARRSGLIQLRVIITNRRYGVSLSRRDEEIGAKSCAIFNHCNWDAL